MTYTQKERLFAAVAYLLTLVNVAVWCVVAINLSEILR
jgi:hypothetical protein